MRKKITVIAILLVICFLFSGCSKTKLSITVNAKAKLKTSLERLVTKDYYSMSADKEITTKQVYKELKKDIKKSYKKSKKSLKFKKIQKKIDGEKYYGYKVAGIKKADLDGVKCYKKNGRIYFEIKITSSDTGSGSQEEMTPEEVKELLGVMEAGGISSKYVIKFPHKPKTTYGKVKGKTVTINMLKFLKKHPDGKGKIVISCKA